MVLCPKGSPSQSYMPVVYIAWEVAQLALKLLRGKN